MPISFPDKSEVRLANPPLEEVICQVRFPIILKIAKEEPDDFQEEIRHSFPKLELTQAVRLQLPPLGVADEPLAEMRPRVYRFQTIDEQTTISLASDFYAVTTNQYKHWVDFADVLQTAHKAMLKVYRISHATRIGLRYVNRLTLENTGSQTKDELFSLLCSELTSMLRGAVWEDAETMSCQLAFKQQGERLNFRVKCEQVQGAPNFVLDFDYFEEGTLPLEGLIERCDQYHRNIYNAFRWCLLDEGLEQFQPISNGE